MNHPPRLAGRLDVLTEGGLKRMANMPCSAVLLLCLYLLGSGIFMAVRRLLSAFGDEIAQRRQPFRVSVTA